jgi:hypothetical protein
MRVNDMTQKLEQFQKLLQLTNEGLTREEFFSEFKKVIQQVFQIEVKMLEKINLAIDNLKSDHETMKGDTQYSLDEMKEQCMQMIKEANKSFILKTEKMFEEQRNGMNFIHDKVRRIKEGVDGEQGPAGKDADESKIITEVLKKVPKTDVSDFVSKAELKVLEEEIETLKRMKRLGGVGGTSYLGIQQHFVNSEVPTGTVNGTNTVFTLEFTPNPTDSLRVFVNGARMKSGGEDFTVSNRTITFVTAPPTTSIILVDYMK